MLNRLTSYAAAACITMTAGIALAQKGGGAPGAGVEPLTTVRVATGLAWPVSLAHSPEDYKRLYIVEKPGRIKVLDLTTGLINPTVFLDINSLVGGGSSTNDERGLLGLAFHPDFENNGFFFVNYTNNSGNTVVARYTATTPDLADPGSALQIITYSQPYTNHNGGWLGFGPNDGYLYISAGDGGSGGDPGNRAQDITNQRLGKLLRIDIDSGLPYSNPPSNPFFGITGDDEIWAYGLRNPWRCSFDRETGDLYIADVGQGAWEEIDFQPADSPGGENYGLRCYEGNHNYNLVGCDPPDTMEFPIHEYSHSTGFSITGGYVYRGCAIPTLRGAYFFGDYVTDRIWSFVYEDGSITNFQERTAELVPDIGAIDRISTFGEDARGEIYIVDQGTGSSGEIFKIVPVTPTISPADIDCSGTVDIIDLLMVLAAWGPCEGCPEDTDGNGTVDILDLLTVLAEWG